MGNPIGGGAAAETPAKPEKKGFEAGDAVEIKEGGKVYRAAVIVKFDEGIGAVDVK